MESAQEGAAQDYYNSGAVVSILVVMESAQEERQGRIAVDTS